MLLALGSVCSSIGSLGPSRENTVKSLFWACVGALAADGLPRRGLAAAKKNSLSYIALLSIIAASWPTAGAALVVANLQGPTSGGVDPATTACTAASPTTFDFTADITAEQDDGGTVDAFSSYLLDGSGKIIDVEGFLRNLGTQNVQITLETLEDPQSTPFTLIIADDLGGTPQTRGSAYVSGANGETEITRFSFDPSTIDLDASLEDDFDQESAGDGENEKR